MTTDHKAMESGSYPIPVLKPGMEPTLEMIKAELKLNPPGRSVLDYHLEFFANAPTYLLYLLDRLRRTEKRLHHQTRKKRK
jgi:hypothetical protein